MRIVKSNKTVNASECTELSKSLETFLEDVAQSVGPFDYNAFMNKCWTSAAISKIKQLRNEWNEYAEDDEVAAEIGADIQKVLDGLKSKSVDACDDVKASKQSSADDQALKHIKAAIDILGKSGNKDAVTKDSIIKALDHVCYFILAQIHENHTKPT